MSEKPEAMTATEFAWLQAHCPENFDAMSKDVIEQIMVALNEREQALGKEQGDARDQNELVERLTQGIRIMVERANRERWEKERDREHFCRYLAAIAGGVSSVVAIPINEGQWPESTMEWMTDHAKRLLAAEEAVFEEEESHGNDT